MDYHIPLSEQKLIPPKELATWLEADEFQGKAAKSDQKTQEFYQDG